MASYAKNLIAIQEHLDAGETISNSCGGQFETKRLGNNSVRPGIFVTTENRLIFFAKKWSGYEIETFPYTNISAIELSKGLLGKTINLKMSGNEAKLKWIQEGDPDALISFIRKHMGEKTHEGSTDIPGQIQKLAELRDSGILTEDEFTVKKVELLNKI
jgi:hypothetical protein